MLVARTRWMMHWFYIALFSLLANGQAQPCARLYMQGLDSTTTVYPQLAGVYQLQTLQTSLLSQWVSVTGTDLRHFVYQ